jgi:glycosyltransferase involved in cell wall biosynthesis
LVTAVVPFATLRPVSCMSPFRILTNFERFPTEWSTSNGHSGTSEYCKSLDAYRHKAKTADLFLINCDVNLTLGLALASLRNEYGRVPLVAVDLVLRRPVNPRARLTAMVKKRLLRRVDHFINYFRESEGYARYFGITPQRSSATPFKANLRYRHEPSVHKEGEYVLCFGRSLRDYDTFFQAVGQLPYPAAIPYPDLKALRMHTARFTYSLDQLPKNVRLLEDDGSQERLIQIIEGARIVVIPILASSILGGNSVSLNAMFLNKCVIVSEGPGISDMLTPDQVVMVPPEKPDALAAAIREVWEDDALRRQIANAGYEHALSLGGEPELFQRILDLTMAWYSARPA